jgi:hypothetical protein
MELVIVERVYEEPLTDEIAEELRRKAGPCFAMRRIRWLSTYLSKNRLRAICMYEAPDAASVRDAHDQEGFPYARIWAALPPMVRDDAG